jgi:hypothetical protein
VTTSWTQADIEALEAAIKGGTLRVRFENREVQYQSTSEMLKLLQAMKDAVAGESPAGVPNRTTYATFRKGPRPGFSE